MMCERWCVTKWCVKYGGWKMVCDKLVCQRWWVTERCVKYSMLCDKVVRVCVKDGVSKMVGAKVVCVCERRCVKDGG